MLSIREASVEDSEAIARIQVDGWRAEYHDIVPHQTLDELRYDEQTRRWRRVLSSSPSVTHVAEDGGVIVGFSSLGPARDSDAPPNSGELYALYVAPQRVRQGVGSSLLRHMLQSARPRYKRLACWVTSNHVGSMRFFSALGFDADAATRIDAPFDGVTVPVARLARWLLPPDEVAHEVETPSDTGSG